MVIFGEAECVWTSDIGKDSKNNFPFEKEGTGQVSVKKLENKLGLSCAKLRIS